jgi:hypothetical protein
MELAGNLAKDTLLVQTWQLLQLLLLQLIELLLSLHQVVELLLMLTVD